MRCGCFVLAAASTDLLVLLWHGRGPHEGHVLRPLADALVAAGATVVVPRLGQRRLCLPATTACARTGLAAATAAVLEAVRLAGDT